MLHWQNLCIVRIYFVASVQGHQGWGEYQIYEYEYKYEYL